MPNPESQTTPFLDLAKELPQGRSNDLAAWQIVLVLVMLFGGVPAIIALADYSPAFWRALERYGRAGNAFLGSLEGPFPGLLLLVFTAVAATAISLHELGHFAAGSICGLRLQRLQIGFLALARNAGKWTLECRFDSRFGGFTNMRVERICRLRRRLALYVAGGPLANLLSALVLASFLRMNPARLLSLRWINAGWLFVGFSVFLMLANVIPYRLHGLFNDGARLWMLRFSRRRTRRWMSLLALQNQASQGVRPSAWKRTWVRAATATADASVDALLADWMAYIHANDREDELQAAICLEHCLSQIQLAGPLFRRILTLEASVFTAWFRRHASRADRWFAKVDKPRRLPSFLRLRGEVALAWVHGDTDKAIAVLEQALAMVRRLPESRERSSQERGWLEWKQQMIARAGAPTSGTS